MLLNNKRKGGNHEVIKIDAELKTNAYLGMQIGSYLKLTFNKYTVLQHYCLETKSVKLYPPPFRFSNQKFF